MSAASDRINGIIDQALSQASIAQADAGAYANAAIRATDTIRLVEGTGDVTGAPLAALAALPAKIDMPKFEDPRSAFGQTEASVTAQLQSGFTGVLQSYFPDIQLVHENAVDALEALMLTGADSVRTMQKRLDRDASAVTWLGSKFQRADQAHTYEAERLDAGRAAAGFMQTKFTLAGNAAAFLARRFTLGDTAAQQLVTMITSGGTGLTPSVEAQLWERDRARVVKEGARVQAAAMDTFASRGYPLPPGALAMQILMTQADTQDKVSRQSGDVAIKSIDILIENIRTAATQGMSGSGDAGSALLTDAGAASRALIEDAQAAARLTIEDAREAAALLLNDSMRAAELMLQQSKDAAREVINLRQQALGAAVDYMRALALGPQIGADLARSIVQAQTAASDAITRYYSAQVQAVSSYNDSAVRISQLTYEPLHDSAANRTALHAAFNNGLIGVANAKANAALGAAQAAGNMGAAAISTLNAIASLTSSD